MNEGTELGRLQSLSSSPIYAQYSETLDGLDTIRAFHWQGALKRENQDLVVANQRVDYCVFAADWYEQQITSWDWIGALTRFAVCRVCRVQVGWEGGSERWVSLSSSGSRS
jgi:hypothetical protein